MFSPFIKFPPPWSPGPSCLPLHLGACVLFTFFLFHYSRGSPERHRKWIKQASHLELFAQACWAVGRRQARRLTGIPGPQGAGPGVSPVTLVHCWASTEITLKTGTGQPSRRSDHVSLLCWLYFFFPVPGIKLMTLHFPGRHLCP